MRNFAFTKPTALAARLGFVIAAVISAAALIAPTAFMQQDTAPTSIAAVDREAPNSKTPMTKPGQTLAPIQLDAPRPNAPEVASNYAFATATNASLTDMSTGTTQLVAANLDDTASAVQNITFDFYFQGVRFSQFSANSNGLIRLGAVAVQGGSPYKPLAQAGQSLITAYGADQRTHLTGKVHFKVIGAAPNRTLVIEWLNMQSDFNAGSTADLTYQARLNETTGVIEFVYGSMTMNAAGAADVNSRDPNIGFSSSNTAGNVGSIAAPQSGAPPPSFNGASATPTANLYTAGAITVLTSAAQGSRRSFTLTPPTPTAPTALSFTGVTGTAMTLNWVDSPDETLYAVYRSTDGINYAFDGTAAQNATSYPATGLAPSTNYFWRVFAVSEGALSTALAGSQMTNAPTNITCNGAGGNWSAAGSWTGGVPTNADNVTIGVGCTITVDVTTAVAFNVTVQSGGILQYITTPASTLTVSANVTVDSGGTITAGAGVLTTHVLSIGGNLVNNGTLDLFTTAGVGLTFTGAASNTMSGTGATTDIRTMTLNKGTNANVLEITTSNFTVQNVNTDVAGFLTLTGGTLKISGTFTMTNRVFLTAIYVIPAAGGIWLNNPNFTVAGTNTSTTSGNNGLFRLTQGVYTIGLAIADGFETASATSVYIIEGGTLNANGRFDPQGACNFTMTGGTINCAVVGNNRSAFGSFEIFSTAATFNMSGGTINLINPSTGATKDDFAMTATTQNITGGQIVFGGPGAPATSTYGTPFGTSFAPNVVVNPTMTWNINNVTVFFRGTTVTNNGAITSTGANARFDFANAGAAMSYGGSGTFGTLAVPFGGVGVSTNSLFLITLNSPIVALRNNLFTGGFINSGQMTLGNGGASSSVVQIGSAGLLTPGGSYDSLPVHNQGTAGQFLIYQQESVLRTTGFEVNPTRSLNFLSVVNTNNVSIAGGDLTCTSVAASPNNALTLTSGRLITNAFNVILPNAASVVVRTAGHVDGNLRKNYSAIASKLFEVGTANGFSPVTVNATAGTFPSDFTVKATQGPQPSVNPATSVQRYWTLTEAGDITATLTFQYLLADVLGTEANYKVIRVIGGTAVAFPASTVNTVAHNATLAGVSVFSDWTVGEIAAPTAAPATISGTVTSTSGAPMAGVTMYLNGARTARTITDSNGAYRFVNVDTDRFYTVTPAIVNYNFSPSSRSFSLLADLSNAVFTGTRDASSNVYAIDTPEYFVRQHYLDFLGREPDAGGLMFWSDQILECGTDFNCMERRTINVSAAYFLSIEHQETGNLVDRLYRVSYGRAPLFAEYVPDTREVAGDLIVGAAGWEATLTANKRAFVESWVQRAAFRAAYDNLGNEGYVDALLNNTGVSFTDSEREALVSGLNGGGLTRAAALQQVVQNESFVRARFNEAFVRMQYFAYLRRDPDDAGFRFWLNKLNQFNGNFEQAEMVKAFLVSGEYRDRFRP